MPKSERLANSLSPVFVSQGDVTGVAWPLFLRLLERQKLSKKQMGRIIVVGVSYESELSRLRRIFKVIPIEEFNGEPGEKPHLLFFKKSKSYTPGKPAKVHSRNSFESFEHAMTFWQKYSSSSLVTLPVSKENIMSAGIEFSGHTELVSKAMSSPGFMCLHHPRLSVVPLTNHVALRRVPAALLNVDYEALGAALHDFSATLGDHRPMAMVGLNPHAGEGGRIGDEEVKLAFGLKHLRRLGLPIEGLFAADGFFMPDVRRHFGLVVTCYHDQALAPFKAIFGLAGINITLNLPQLRVSPDHGTAYELATTNRGDDKSILYSLRFALKWGDRWNRQFSSR